MTKGEVWSRAERLASREVVITGEIPFDWYKKGSAWNYLESDITDKRECAYLDGVDWEDFSLEDSLKLRNFAFEAESKYIEKEKKLMEDKLMADWLVKNAYSPEYAPNLVKTLRQMCKETGIGSLYDKDIEKFIAE